MSEQERFCPIKFVWRLVARATLNPMEELCRNFQHRTFPTCPTTRDFHMKVVTLDATWHVMKARREQACEACHDRKSRCEPAQREDSCLR